MRFLRSIKIPKMNLFGSTCSLHLENRSEASGSTVSGESYPLGEQGTIGIHSESVLRPVANVLPVGANTKIAQPVIPGVSIDMVDYATFRAIQTKHPVDDPVGHKGDNSPFQKHVHVNAGWFPVTALSAFTSSLFSGPSRIGSSLKPFISEVMNRPGFPRKDSGIRVVGEALVKVFCRWQFKSLFHARSLYIT